MAERRSKYGAVQTIGDDGHPYDSALERDCARVLDLLVQQGRIGGYHRQVSFELAPASLGCRPVQYVTDFALYSAVQIVATTPTGRPQREDVVALIESRGYEPAASRLKRRWFMDKYPDIPLWVVRAPEEVVAVVEEIERAHAAKESTHARHCEPD